MDLLKWIHFHFWDLIETKQIFVWSEGLSLVPIFVLFFDRSFDCFTIVKQFCALTNTFFPGTRIAPICFSKMIVLSIKNIQQLKLPRFIKIQINFFFSEKSSMTSTCKKMNFELKKNCFTGSQSGLCPIPLPSFSFFLLFSLLTLHNNVYK